MIINSSLEKLNKNLLLVAILSLVYRKGSFAALGVPKPFEILFVFVVIIGIIDILKNKKIKEFISAIPTKVWGAVSVLTASILLGWGVAVLWKDVPTTGNMLLEFGTYTVSIGTFLLVLFYTRNDEKYAAWYLYALLVSVLFIPILLYPPLANILQLSDGPNNALNGLTDNVSISSRIFIVPAIFFATQAVFERRQAWKILYFVLAGGSGALVFWAVERGAILAMILGVFFVWLVYMLRDFSVKKMILSGLFALSIIALGFIMTPDIGKRIVINRTLNPDTHHTNFSELREKTIVEVTKESKFISSKESTDSSTPKGTFSSESRLVIWPFYLSLAARHPFGIGPNTHIDAYIDHERGAFHNPGPHNAYIQVFLWGGIVALLSFVYLIGSGIQNQYLKLQHTVAAHDAALWGVLGTLAIAIVFNDSLQLYTFWIILALSLRPWKYR